MIPLAPVAKITTILNQTKTIAIVGLSPKQNRPSHEVANYLDRAGFRIIPVNPGQTEILGKTCYPNLASIAEPVDLVDIFRRSDQVLPIVKQAIAKGCKTIWMQEGVTNEEAAELAEAAGLSVIMDRCIKVDHHTYLAKSR